MQQVDSETLKIITEGEKLENFVKSDNWVMVRQKLSDKIAELQSILNVPDGTPEEVMIQIAARQVAIHILLDWLKDVESTAEQNAANKQMAFETEEIIGSI